MHPTDYEKFAERTADWQTSHGAHSTDLQGADACEAATAFFREYARERPEVVALWTFGIGFVLGWKLKPW